MRTVRTRTTAACHLNAIRSYSWRTFSVFWLRKFSIHIIIIIQRWHILYSRIFDRRRHNEMKVCNLYLLKTQVREWMKMPSFDGTMCVYVFVGGGSPVRQSFCEVVVSSRKWNNIIYLKMGFPSAWLTPNMELARTFCAETSHTTFH